jgi:hypothetical protein
MSMSPAITVPRSIARAAANGIARLIFPTRTGILARPNRAWASFLFYFAAGWPLAVAQQPPREFLTEARASVSVKDAERCFAPLRAKRKLFQVRESIGQRDHYAYD